ncbi:MAG: FAD-dependent oxidoreductase [Candidatus Lokiarchaeota archaeon]|nr:FAD-dependent oxidoreductase [Candidatus Lokiarchaeota archaeon]
MHINIHINMEENLELGFDQQSTPDLDKYDAIIIGAGLGGLGAATQLTKEGKNILLLEKHNAPGGFATSFVRGRFEFESALHELSGFGTPENPSGLYSYFTELGLIPDKIQFHYAPELYACVFQDGQKYVLPYDPDEYGQYLILHFPHEKENILKFIKVIKNIYEGMSGPIKPLRILFKHMWLIRALGMSTPQFLRKFFTDVRLMNVIQQFWAYLSKSPEDSSAVLFIGALMSYLTKKAAFPDKRSHNMSQLLCEYVLENGGEIRLNSLVNKIITQNERAIGVELINGQRYFGKSIISNVNPVCTVSKMLPKGTFKDSYIKRITAPPLGSSIFTVYLGLNKSPETLGIDLYEVFINLSDDINEAALHTNLDQTKIMVATCYNLIDPDISPPGTTMLALAVLHPGEIWQSVPPTKYFDMKEKVANDLIDVCEDILYPNIRESIEVVEIASPLTYYRYSKHLNGTIYGTNTNVLDNPVLKLKQRTPLKGLYFCGSWIGEGGGYDPSFNSGRKAAKYVLRQFNEDGGK